MRVARGSSRYRRRPPGSSQRSGANDLGKNSPAILAGGWADGRDSRCKRHRSPDVTTSAGNGRRDAAGGRLWADRRLDADVFRRHLQLRCRAAEGCDLIASTFRSMRNDAALLIILSSRMPHREPQPLNEVTPAACFSMIRHVAEDDYTMTDRRTRHAHNLILNAAIRPDGWKDVLLFSPSSPIASPVRQPSRMLGRERAGHLSTSASIPIMCDVRSTTICR